MTILAPTLRFYRELPEVDGFKAYLKFFESAPESKLTLFTDNADFLREQNFFDNVKVFVDAFNLLRQKFSLPKDFKSTFGRNDDWIKLAQMIAVDGSFERAFCREFAIDKFNVHVLENFGERNDFQQWLLWLRCKLMNVGYVYRCAKKSSSPKEFVERLFGEIISCRNAKNFDELCAERREILAVMKILPLENFIAADLATLGENFSVKYRVGFCNLPSVTELNKDFLQGRSIAADILDLL